MWGTGIWRQKRGPCEIGSGQRDQFFFVRVSLRPFVCVCVRAFQSTHQCCMLIRYTIREVCRRPDQSVRCCMFGTKNIEKHMLQRRLDLARVWWCHPLRTKCGCYTAQCSLLVERVAALSSWFARQCGLRKHYYRTWWGTLQPSKIELFVLK